MNLLCFCVLLLFASVHSEGQACCSRIARHTTCRDYCQQVLQDGWHGHQIQQLRQVLTVANHCPADLAEFWQCLNTTLPVMQQIAEWTGRPCCDRAVSQSCKQACQQASSMRDVNSGRCDRHKEKQLFRCLNHNKEGDGCCRQSRNTSCSMVCRGFFLTASSSVKPSRDVVFRHCKGASVPVAKCVQNQTRHARANNPKDNLPCCSKAKTDECRTECHRLLHTQKSENEIIEELILTCGAPDMREAMWQCFLVSPSPKNETPSVTVLDSAKLQCCAKAASDRCRELCSYTFTKNWAQQFSEFEKTCSLIQPVSTALEAPMHNCLTDVEEPCKLGCNNLKYCSNFNFRPTEHFRSCTPQTDDAARETIRNWRAGIIELPQMRIPVKDISHCEPEMWKAIACIVQIKPCHTKPSPISICQEDCIHILNKCVDKSALESGQTVHQLCNPLPKQSDAGACISVSKYLKKSSHVDKVTEVSSPCHPDPCGPGKVCLVRRRKCKHTNRCHPYICKEACLLGHASTFAVPHGAIVRIPDEQRSRRKQQCYKVCRCEHTSQIGGCSPVSCQESYQCIMGAYIKDHGSHFMVDGSLCICNSGNLICARRTCSVDSNLAAAQFTGMPGNCPAKYHPTCATNGKTYPNSCLAKCAGFDSNDLQIGLCSSVDPCQGQKCRAGTTCIKRRQVCLAMKDGQPCPQHECVPEKGSTQCNVHFHDPVCNTQGEEFTNACLMKSSDAKLAYRGHCMGNCAKAGTVCGHNGETYDSECAALADRVTMDYRGECRAFGNLTANAPKSSTCNHVKCPDLRPRHCRGITPPGACCPICAAELQVLFDPRLVEAAAAKIGQGPMSVKSVLAMLSDHLMVAECDVFGYLSVEGTIIVILAPITQEPTELQVEACSSEAVRLEHLIRTGSPTLMSYLTLTPLLLAPVRTPSLGQTSAASVFSSSITALMMLLILTLIISRTKL